MTSHRAAAVDALVAELAPRAASGQRELALTMRHVVHRLAPDLFLALDFDDDATFLEPLGFSLAVTPGADAAAVYAGYVPASDRPPLRLRADERGRVHLPRLGVARTGRRDGEVRVVWEDGRAMVDGDPLAWVPLPSLVPGSMELATLPIAALEQCFADEEGHRTEVEIPEAAPALQRDIVGALAALEHAARPVYDLLAAVGRLVVVFDDERLNSFATPRAHGVAFLNVHLGATVPGFVDDLTHQFGHTLFTAAAGDGAAYLALPPDTPLGRLNGEPRDRRTLLVALHGLVTESLIVGGLDACIAAGAFTGDDRDEALGRLSFVGRRLAIDLRNLSHPAALTGDGRRLVERMQAILAAALEERADELRGADLTGQGYTFDVAGFRRVNGLVAGAA